MGIQQAQHSLAAVPRAGARPAGTKASLAQGGKCWQVVSSVLVQGAIPACSSPHRQPSLLLGLKLLKHHGEQTHKLFFSKQCK